MFLRIIRPVQPVVSQRLKALEDALGRKLLEHTPRFVRPTPEGAAFLGRARALLRAHHEALALEDPPTLRVSVAISDDALGLGIEHILARLRGAEPRRPLLRRG